MTENNDGETITIEEVTVLPIEDKVSNEEEIRENPINISKYTAGITWQGIAGGVGGMVVSAAVPKAVKWDTGWKDVLVTAVTAVGGGYLLKRYVDKQAGLGFVIGGLSLATIKAIRQVTGKSTALVGDVGSNDLIYGDYMGDVGDDIFSEDELFGIDDDPIIPTAGIDDF